MSWGPVIAGNYISVIRGNFLAVKTVSWSGVIALPSACSASLRPCIWIFGTHVKAGHDVMHTYNPSKQKTEQKDHEFSVGLSIFLPQIGITVQQFPPN